MNTASTSKEHGALLTEMNTLKADRGQYEERALELMESLERLRAELEEVEAELAERTKVRQVAENDREQKAADIKDRVAELEKQREAAAAEVPASALGMYDALREARDADEVMASVEEQDRRNKEYSCGSCYTHLPVEQVNILLNRGDVTTCPACDVILYMEDELRDSLISAAEKRRKRREVEIN